MGHNLAFFTRDFRRVWFSLHLVSMGVFDLHEELPFMVGIQYVQLFPHNVRSSMPPFCLSDYFRMPGVVFSY